MLSWASTLEQSSWVSRVNKNHFQASQHDWRKFIYKFMLFLCKFYAYLCYCLKFLWQFYAIWGVKMLQEYVVETTAWWEIYGQFHVNRPRTIKIQRAKWMFFNVSLVCLVSWPNIFFPVNHCHGKKLAALKRSL